MSEFDEAIALQRMGTDGESTAWRGRLSDRWSVGTAVNGGLLMALAANAVRDAVAEAGEGAHRDPIALSAHFMSAAAPGDLDVTTEVLRRGRRMSTGQAALVQDGEDGPVERMRALVTVADLEPDGTVHRCEPAPDMPAPDACVPSSAAPAELAGAFTLTERLDVRFDPETVGFAVGAPSGRGELRAWMRLADGREFDSVALLLALDALPPVAFDLGLMGWAPTIEFSGHVWARPAPGWLRMRTRTQTLVGGVMEEVAWIWDSRDRLVAQSRQMCGVRVPKDGLPVSA